MIRFKKKTYPNPSLIRLIKKEVILKIYTSLVIITIIYQCCEKNYPRVITFATEVITLWKIDVVFEHRKI